MKGDTDNHQPAEEVGGMEDEDVGDLLGSFSDEPAPNSNKQGFKSYGSSSYGSTGNTNQPTNQQSKYWLLVEFSTSQLPLFLCY